MYVIILWLVLASVGANWNNTFIFCVSLVCNVSRFRLIHVVKQETKLIVENLKRNHTCHETSSRVYIQPSSYICIICLACYRLYSDLLSVKDISMQTWRLWPVSTNTFCGRVGESHQAGRKQFRYRKYSDSPHLGCDSCAKKSSLLQLPKREHIKRNCHKMYTHRGKKNFSWQI